MDKEKETKRNLPFHGPFKMVKLLVDNGAHIDKDSVYYAAQSGDARYYR